MKDLFNINVTTEKNVFFEHPAKHCRLRFYCFSVEQKPQL